MLFLLTGGGSVGRSILLYEPNKSAHDSSYDENMGAGGSSNRQ